MRLLTTIVLLMGCAAAFANDPGDSIVVKPSRYYFSVRSAALLCNDCDIDGNSVALLSTVHGIRLNRTFSIGAGLGLTSARSTWIAPAFGNLRMNLSGRKTNKFFVEMNYGGGFTFGGSQGNEWQSEETKCKRYFQPSVGYSIKYHDLNIGILVGLQALKMVTRYTYPSYSWWSWNGAGTPSTSDYTYQVSRLMVGISVGWRD